MIRADSTDAAAFRADRGLVIAILASAAALLAGAPAAHAERTLFTDQAAYVAAVGAAGYDVVHEGFEDDTAWGSVRSTIPGGFVTAPSVTNLGVTWTTNAPTNEVTTGSGAAHSGSWGFYAYPHGDQGNGFHDGWVATHEDRFYAFGGWIRSNTPYASVIFVLDGDELDPADFEDVPLGTSFLGVLDTDGFTSVEVRETESQPDDWKYVFGDDFRWGVAAASTCVDGDGDGYGAPASPDCAFPDEDCDDTNPAVNPGAVEIPGNGIDDDCDATTPAGCEPARIGHGL